MSEESGGRGIAGTDTAKKNRWVNLNKNADSFQVVVGAGVGRAKAVCRLTACTGFVELVPKFLLVWRTRKSAASHQAIPPRNRRCYVPKAAVRALSVVSFSHPPPVIPNALLVGTGVDGVPIDMLPLGQCEQKAIHQSFSLVLPNFNAPTKPSPWLARVLEPGRTRESRVWSAAFCPHWARGSILFSLSILPNALHVGVEEHGERPLAFDFLAGTVKRQHSVKSVVGKKLAYIWFFCPPWSGPKTAFGTWSGRSGRKRLCRLRCSHTKCRKMEWKAFWPRPGIQPCEPVARKGSSSQKMWVPLMNKGYE